MRVYQHSARCPVALRAFLDCNPQYQCFIPMPWHDALVDNLNYFGRSWDGQESMATIDATEEHHDPRVNIFLVHLPDLPHGYVFSYRQEHQQRQFVRRFLELPPLQLPYRSLDLYQYKVLAVCL